MSEQILSDTPYKPTNLLHLNGNVLCAIDCETTGLIPGKHEIVEICFLPLDANLKPKRDIVPFDIQIRPDNTDDIDWDSFKVTKIDFARLCQSGIDKYDAADLFERWAEKLQLAMNKRISPLAHNWVFDSAFIRAWLGPKTYEYYIDGRYRDVMSTGLYLDDVEDRKNERIPFPKVNLSYMASQLRVPHERAHSALGDCITTAEVYRELVYGSLPVKAAFIG